MNTRSNGSRPWADVTTCMGTVMDSSRPVCTICSPPVLSRCARTAFASRNVTSSPARVRNAPASPPSAPAPTIRILIVLVAPALPRRSSVPPYRAPFVDEGRESFAHVFRHHQFVKEHSFSCAARDLEWLAVQRSRHPHVHPHHERTRAPHVREHTVQRRRQFGMRDDARHLSLIHISEP